jgi:hypothetical protein
VRDRRIRAPSSAASWISAKQIDVGPGRAEACRGIFKSPADVHVEFWDYTIHRAGDVFWAVGRERGTYLDGEIVRNLNVRTTRIFQLINGRWRQMHHHGSIEDAKLLGDHQNAVRSSSPKTLK